MGTKRNTEAPADDRGTAVLVTGRRTLCLVEGADSDTVIQVPHRSVTRVVFRRELLAKRFVLTTPQKKYHCWVPRGTETDQLEAAVEFVRDRTVDDPGGKDSQ